MSENIKPYDPHLPKEAQIREMFDHIAPRYDLLNRLLSLRQDVRWRRVVVQHVMHHKPAKVLDVATGTGDLALALCRAGVPEVTGLDISKGMLERARLRAAESGCKALFVQGSALEMPFESDYFDVVTVAFGVRNFQDIRRGLSEMLRVTKPGGYVYILEFSQPSATLLRKLVGLYNRLVVPGTGRLLSGDFKAYKYLDESVKNFPYGRDFLNILESCGWQNASAQPLSGGIVSVYAAHK